MESSVATKLSIYMGLLIFAAGILPRAECVAWVVGQQTSGYVGPFIGRYDEWLVGNPRKVSYGSGFDLGNDLGQICGGPWNKWAVIGNSQPDNFDFNCIPTPAEITANSNNIGYYVGGLNSNGVTIALCYVTSHDGELCDSDTVSDSGSLACVKYLKCT